MDTTTIVIVYAALLLFALAPFISVFLASAIASAAGTELNEGGADPCMVGGVDIGPWLYGMFVAGWLVLITLPMGGCGLLGFTLYLMFR